MSFFSFISGMFGASSSTTRATGGQNPLPSSAAYSTSSTVTSDSSLQVSSVFACVRLIAETVGGLPFKLMRVVQNGSDTEDKTHTVISLLQNKPNRYQTAQEFLESVIFNLVLWGNSYVRITRSGNRIVSLLPLPASQVEVILEKTGEVRYFYTVDGTRTEYPADQIWHIKLFGNGIIGLSPLGFARLSIGTAIATDSRVSTLASSGHKPSGFLMYDRLLRKDQRQQIRESFTELSTNGDGIHVLEAGMKFQPLTMSPKDVELLESRRFQVEDISRFFGVPSVLIGSQSAGTTWGSGISQIVSGWYRLGLKPYIKRIESTAMQSLFTPIERQQYYIKLDLDDLLLLDLKDRLEMYGDAVQAGQITPNEARAFEGRGKVDGGDVLYMQAQMTPIQNLKNNVSPESNQT